MVKILHLTQKPADAVQVHRALCIKGFICEERVVDNRPEFISCLELGRFDIILSDYRTLGFGGLPALELSLESRPEVPFLFFSDSVGDEYSVEALKHGAVDFVLKNNSARLVLAIQRALQLAVMKSRRNQRKLACQDAQITGDQLELMPDVSERRLMEGALRDSHRRFTAFMDNLPGFAWMKDLQGRYTYINKRLECLPEYRNGWRGKTDADLWPPETAAHCPASDRRVIAQGETIQVIESHVMGEEQSFVLVNKFPILDDAGQILMVGGSAVDVTEHKRAERLLSQMSGQILQAQEAERKRIARELHDGVSQTLSQARTRMQALTHQGPGCRREAMEVQTLLARTQEEVRRISHNLMPSELGDLGLLPAVRSLCRDYEHRAGATVSLEHSNVPGDLADDLKLALFRIIQEAFNNIEKHARATKIELSIRAVERELKTVIQDDGLGFHPGRLPSAGVRDSRMGLSNMRERAAAVGGTLDIVSLPNQGTMIQLCVPLKTQSDHQQPQP